MAPSQTAHGGVLLGRYADIGGIAGQLLAVSCQLAKPEQSFAIPQGLALWGIDSGIRHQVSVADYGEVRTAAFMGYRIIADRLAMPAELFAPGRIRIRDDLFGGFLANVPPDRFRSELLGALPERMTGREFLERHGGITDELTEVRPDSTWRWASSSAISVSKKPVRSRA